MVISVKIISNHRSEHNFYQKNQQIIIAEEILIDECLMLLSGLKPNLVFLFVNNEVVFNKKFQLASLNKVKKYLQIDNIKTLKIT